MKTLQLTPNPNRIRQKMNRRDFLGAALALAAATSLAACSGSSDDEVSTTTGTAGGSADQKPSGTSGHPPTSTETTGGSTDTSCQEKCPVCGAVCWFKKDVQPHECPNGHYWKTRNGVWYVMDWNSGIYYDANGHPY